jgi:hypothetical protein
VKSGAEQSFLYGNHVAKSGLGRITENTDQYQGVVVYSMNDLPLVRLFGGDFSWVFLRDYHPMGLVKLKNLSLYVLIQHFNWAYPRS